MDHPIDETQGTETQGIGAASTETVWETAPSPCIDVCKYKRQGRCIACSMTKDEKQRFPENGGAAAKRAFIDALMERLSEIGRNPAFWAATYRHKCERAGVPCPIAFEAEEDGRPASQESVAGR